MTIQKKRPLAAVILAAGKSTRMKTETPKVLHTLLGKSIIAYITEACQKAGVQRIILVIGHQADRVREALGETYEYAEQTEQLGTGHALMMAAGNLKHFKGDILVLAGDTPLLTGGILKKLIRKHQTTQAAAAMMTAELDPTPPYGRVIRDEAGDILRIVEDRDATPAEKLIKEVNTSHYCFQSEKVMPLLSQISTDNDQGEYYLTDIIEFLARRKEKIASLTAKDTHILLGINDRSDLARISGILKNAILEKWMKNGVTLVDPAAVYIEGDVKIGGDTVIYPFTTLTGKTIIGKHCTIGPNVRIHNGRIGDNSRIEFSVIENRKIDTDTVIGPFASISGELSGIQ